MRTHDTVDQRLHDTAQRLVAQPSVAAGVMQQIAAEPSPARRHRPLIFRITAAVVVLAATAVVVTVNTSSPAYGMAGAAERLREVKSLYVRGRHIFTPKDGQEVIIPVEHYLEPPHRYLQTSIGFGPDQVRSFTSMADGNRYLSLSHNDRKAFTGTQPLLHTELSSASAYQMLATQLGVLGPLAQDYRKAGQGEVNGVACDLYQLEHGKDGDAMHATLRLWLDPQSGLPVRFRSLMVSNGDHHLVELDTITVGGPPPQVLRNLKPPDDYDVQHADMHRVEFSSGSAISNSTTMTLKYTVDIDGRAVLLCWAYYDDGPQPPTQPNLAPATPRWLDEPIPANGGGSYRHLILRHDATPEGWHWRWSLLVPVDPKMSITNHAPMLEARGKGYRLSFTPLPLFFSKDRLPEVVSALQKTTLPETADDEAIYTLSELRQFIADPGRVPSR